MSTTSVTPSEVGAEGWTMIPESAGQPGGPPTSGLGKETAITPSNISTASERAHDEKKRVVDYKIFRRNAQNLGLWAPELTDDFWKGDAYREPKDTHKTSSAGSPKAPQRTDDQSSNQSSEEQERNK